MRPFARLLAIAATLASLACGPRAHAQADAATPEQVRVAFVLNFARFTEWPADALGAESAPFVMCFAGRDTLGNALTALEGRTVHGREVRVRRGVRIDEVQACHLLYLADSEERRMAEWIAAAAPQRTLTVGDIEGFCEAGGMIGLVPAANRLQFEINPRATQRAGLKPAAQLLKLARSVRGERG